MAWTERYVRADANGSGNGTTDANTGANGAWTLVQAITNAAAGHRVNVRAGTYAQTTNNRTFGTAGTTTAPVWWRGYTSTAGDQDSKPTTTRVAGTDIPLITFTTGICQFTGAHNYYSNLVMESARTAGAGITVGTGVGQRFVRCRFIATGNAAVAYGVTVSAAATFIACYSTSHANAERIWNFSGGPVLRGCMAAGGQIGYYTTAPAAMALLACVARGGSGVGFHYQPASAVALFVDHCTFANLGSDGIRFAFIPLYASVTNCIFASCGGYGINNSTGTNTNLIARAGNLFYNNTSGNENGFGDAVSFSEQIDSSLPFVSSTDLTLDPGSNANSQAVPNLYEVEGYTSYSDIGAVQREETGGGGGNTYSRSRVVNA